MIYLDFLEFFPDYLPILTKKWGEARIVCWMPSFIYLWAYAQTMWPYYIMTICTIPSSFLVPLKPILASPSGGNPRNDYEMDWDWARNITANSHCKTAKCPSLG